MSKFCQLCNAAEKIRTQEPEKYLQLIDHAYTKYYDGSAPAMEAHGIKIILQSSIEKTQIEVFEILRRR